MADDRANRSFSEASTLLVDTRASQSLEPIRLPAKLRDRIDRAQRRAAAAKDGVSIFTKDATASNSGGTLVRRVATAPVAKTPTTATFGDTNEPHRLSTASGGISEKMHLPDVVLSHKMRDFEARANNGGGVALLSVEPADRSLQRLSLEDRERVMLVMQSKIRQIANEVDANFARLTKTLDANGIFDSSANIQRAQTLCLVDLQRRCKLDRLRDEAMREVLHLPTPSSTGKNRRDQTTGNPSRKLSQLLRPLPEISSGTEALAAMETRTPSRRKRKPVRSPKLPTLHRQVDTLSNNQKPEISSSPLQDPGNGNKSPGRIASRRGGLAPPSMSAQFMTRDDLGFSAGNANNDGDIFARHPYVAQILQLLAVGNTTTCTTKTNINTNTAEADMEHMHMLEPVDEWMQRSASYQAVGSRAAEALRRCSERQRWDTLDHFGSNCVSISCISPALRQRLDNQHSSWGNRNTTTRSEEIDRTRNLEKGFRHQQQHDKEVYTELQTRIRERLRATEKRTRTAAEAVRTSARARQQTAPSKMITGTASTVSLLPQQPQSPLQIEAPSIQLSTSVSEPSLPITTPMSGLTIEMNSFSLQRHSRLGSRMSVLEHKLLDDPSYTNSRHGRRKESLIGAPLVKQDRNAIGRHSEARIAYRRLTAQTWAWNSSPGTNSVSPVDTITEQEEEHDEANDHFDNDQNEEVDSDHKGDGGEDTTEYLDSDLESMDSSRTSFSARSSISMISVKMRTATGSGNRKHGKSKRPVAVQHRPNRGSGGRSAGNTLSGHALSLHARLEVIWRVLQFPFSNKLLMLERLSTLQDAEGFVSALEHWERVTPLVAIRQRMQLALSGFEERGELRPNEWLTLTEFALVAALSKPSSGEAGPNTENVPVRKASTREFDSMSPSSFVQWVRNQIDVVTLQIYKLANELKTHTGDELQFQGLPYLRRE